MSTMRTAREQRLTFDGFGYLCRVVEHPSPSTSPIVIVGGSEENRHSWTRYERWLAPHATLITMDLPGYGDADALPADHGIDFLASVVDHLLRTLRIPSVNLMGACFGAAVALRCAQLHPDRVQRLVLAGMTTEVPGEFHAFMERWREMLTAGRHAEMADDMAAQFTAAEQVGPVRGRAAVVRLIRQRFAERTPRELATTLDHHDRLRRHPWSLPEPAVRAPALVFTGEHDTLTTPAMGRQVAALVGGAFTTVTEADHLAPIERGKEVAELMLRFFTDQPLDGLPYLTAIERPVVTTH